MKYRYFLFVISAYLFSFFFSYAKNIKQTHLEKTIWGEISLSDKKIIKEISQKFTSNDFEAIDNLSTEISDTTISKIYKNISIWNKYSTKKIESKEELYNMISFVKENQFLPNIDLLVNKIFKTINKKKIEYNFIKDRLNDSIFRNGIILLKLKEAANKNNKILLNYRINGALTNKHLDFEFKKKIILKYQDLLIPSNHILYMDMLIWNLQITEAENEINKYEEKYRNNKNFQILKTILKIKNFSGSYRQLFRIIKKDVPKELRSNENLLYHLALFYKENNNKKKVLELLFRLDNRKFLHNEKWWILRRIYGRELLKDKKYKKAYKLISNHRLSKKTNLVYYVDAEWTAGWILLSFLKNPEASRTHFYNFYYNVSHPVNKSTAAYWIGLGYEKKNKYKKALKWYEIGSNYNMYFYGQLSYYKYQILKNISGDFKKEFLLPKNPEITVYDIKKNKNNLPLLFFYGLKLIDNTDSNRVLLNYLQSRYPKDRGQYAIIMKFAKDANDENLVKEIIRYAQKDNVFFIKNQFQIIKNLDVKNKDDLALIHAIIKQESNFDSLATSSVGAKGVMQLMPNTARDVAKKNNIQYSETMLNNPFYNIKLGNLYIKGLSSQFNSKLLAISAYNAGSKNTKRWINEFYDPKVKNDLEEVTNWIELITYPETRNYVKKVLGNLIVYKFIIAQKL